MLNLGQKPLKIAVTGGIATGKSTVCSFFQELGAYCVSTDQIVHELLSNNKEYVKNVISLLGNEIVVDGTINRKKMAEIVFQSREKLLQLEQLTHPLVRNEINRNYEKAKNEGKYPLFIVEIPLLFETEDPNFYDAIIAVVSDDSLAIKRFSEKTGYTQTEYEKRMARQISPKEKIERAHFVIENNRTIDALRNSIKQLFNTLTASLQ